MLELTEEAKRLKSTFLAYRNDIDIYTEDEEKDKEFYKVLFSRLLDGKINIADVTPLGSKDAVKNRCLNEPANGRKKIFVIDGDVTIIHGNNMPALKDLFVLDGYCIENFLLDQGTILHFIYLNCAIRSKEEIAQELNFSVWLDSYSKAFIKLFIHFALCDLFDIKYALYNAYKFHMKDGDTYKFFVDTVENDVSNLKAALVNKVSQHVYDQKLTELTQRWDASIGNLLKIVSGKDYLLPILLIKTACFKKNKTVPPIEEVKMSLVQFCNLDRLAPLKQRIEQIMSPGTALPS